MSRIYDGELETKSFCGSDLCSVLLSSFPEFVLPQLASFPKVLKLRMRQHNGLRIC